MIGEANTFRTRLMQQAPVPSNGGLLRTSVSDVSWLYTYKCFLPDFHVRSQKYVLADV